MNDHFGSVMVNASFDGRQGKVRFTTHLGESTLLLLHISLEHLSIMNELNIIILHRFNVFSMCTTHVSPQKLLNSINADTYEPF